MMMRKTKQDLFGKFDPVLNAVLNTVTPDKKTAKIELAVRQSASPPVRQSASPPVRQSAKKVQS
jgi:hypothetical protein